MNVANNFIHRVFSLTRNKPIGEIATTIQRNLQSNDYPKQLVNRLINLYVNKRQRNSHSQQINPQQAITSQHQLVATPTISQTHRSPPPVPSDRPLCQPTPEPLSDPARRTHSQPFRQPPTQPTIVSAPPIPHTAPEPLPQHRLVIDNTQFHQSNPASNDQNPTRTSNIDEANNNSSMPEQPATENNKIYRSIPYVPALSQRITKILSKDYPDISITTKQHFTVNSLHTKVKDPVKKEEISNVIYKIPCNDCDSCYVGMTRNNLRKRIAGHKSNINRLERLLESNNTNTDTATATLIETTTALIRHCVENNHRFNLDSTQIIDHSYKQTTLPFLEMCHIMNTNNTVNKRTDIDKLSTTYAGVLHSIKSMDEQNNMRRESREREQQADS